MKYFIINKLIMDILEYRGEKCINIDNNIYIRSSSVEGYDISKLCNIGKLDEGYDISKLCNIGELDETKKLTDDKFSDLCRIGNLEEAKKIKVNNDILINSFYIACSYGQFEIVRWIFSLKSQEYFYINFPFAFANSCKSGNIDLVKLLYDETSPNLEHYKYSGIHFIIFNILGDTYNTELYKNERKKFIHYKNDLPFYNALLNGHIEIVKWLYSLEDTEYDITNYLQNTNLFTFACDCGFFSIAEWLLKVYDKKHSMLTDDNFEYICENNIINIAELFVSMSNNYYYEIEDNEIIEWEIGDFIYI